MVLAANIENASDERSSIMSVHSIIRVKFLMHVASIQHAQMRNSHLGNLLKK